MKPGVALPPEPWLGIYYGSVTDDIRDYFSLPDARGVFISRVVAGSPAAEAGIQPGDVILRINQREIVEQDDLAEVIAECKVGDTIMLYLIRNGDSLLLPVTLGDKPQELRN